VIASTTTESRKADVLPLRRAAAALRWAAALFAVAVILHNGDHLRRGAESAPRDVFAIGMAGVVIEVALVVLIYQRHRLAPLAAAVGGVGLAAGYLEVHFLPAHAVLSDSFVSAAHTSPLSWAAATLEVVAALVLAGCGFVVLRHRGLALASRRDSAERGLIDAAMQPIPLILIATQIVGVIVALAQISHG
jgi:hypothetical protein